MPKMPSKSCDSEIGRARDRAVANYPEPGKCILIVLPLPSCYLLPSRVDALISPPNDACQLRVSSAEPYQTLLSVPAGREER